MCTVKKPSVKTDDPTKPLPVLRNPFLDGMLGNVAAIRNGRNAFRINLINPLAIPVTPGAGTGVGGSSPSIGSGGSTTGSSGSNSPTSSSPSGGGSGGGSGSRGTNVREL